MNSSPPAGSDAPSGTTRFEQYLFRNKWRLAIATFFFALVAGCLIGPVPPSRPLGRLTALMQQSRQIGQVLLSYREDHHGKNPPGNSTTEIFQDLLNENYATDPTLFYFPMDGKVRPASNRLKPENVCWDLADPVADGDPDQLPIVFMTGFKMDFHPGGKATRLPGALPYGIAVFYMSNNAIFLKSSSEQIPVISADFNPHGKTYRQLTPTGPLP